MKKSIIAMLCGFCVFFVSAQNRYGPPKQVRESFNREYPQSQPAQWHHANNGWSADFEDRDHGNGEVTAHFDRNGSLLDTHIPYDNNDVPAPVRERVSSRYPGSNNQEYTRIYRPGGDEIYQVHMRHKKRYRTLYVDGNGEQRTYQDRH
jgi:hypothetical protein